MSLRFKPVTLWREPNMALVDLSTLKTGEPISRGPQLAPGDAPYMIMGRVKYAWSGFDIEVTTSGEYHEHVCGLLMVKVFMNGIEVVEGGLDPHFYNAIAAHPAEAFDPLFDAPVSAPAVPSGSKRRREGTEVAIEVAVAEGAGAAAGGAGPIAVAAEAGPESLSADPVAVWKAALAAFRKAADPDMDDEFTEIYDQLQGNSFGVVVEGYDEKDTSAVYLMHRAYKEPAGRSDDAKTLLNGMAKLGLLRNSMGSVLLAAICMEDAEAIKWATFNSTKSDIDYVIHRLIEDGGIDAEESAADIITMLNMPSTGTIVGAIKDACREHRG